MIAKTTFTKLNFNGTMDVSLPDRFGVIMGGPWEGIGGARAFTVKLTESPSEFTPDLYFPIEDFKTPQDPLMFRLLVIKILKQMKSNKGDRVIAIGCTAGLGRTGLVIGCIRKVIIEATESPCTYTSESAIDDTRGIYCSRAIETKAQEQYIRDFDAAKVIRWYRRPNWMIKIGVFFNWV